MNFPVRRLPVIQNWSCHSCGNCCKEYFVTVTNEERKRIESQGWASRPGFEDGPLFLPYGPIWRREYRLRHRADGSCIFLDERGLCRIHAEFGEPAKPIACQLYPYMLVPAGNELRVSVRFSCPSVARNLGRPVTEQADAVRRYARALIPAGARPTKAPPLGRGQRVDWPDLLYICGMLEKLISSDGQNVSSSKPAPAAARQPDPSAPLHHRLVRAISFVRLLEQARLAKLGEGRVRELVDVLAEAARAEHVSEASADIEIDAWAGTLFRLIVAQCARKDLSPHLRSGLLGRWRLFQAATRFARGRGQIPRLQPMFADVAFSKVEQSFGGLSRDSAAMLARYYQIKLSGLQFFGAAFYRIPLIEGFYSLMLTYPVILWIARWIAAGAGRRTLSDDDMVGALTVVDHQWGFAPVFGFGYARRRVRLLASHGQVERLILKYSA